MKPDIHPTFYTDATVTCASCGKSWTTGSTQKEIRVEICSNCHPFFSGEAQRIIDIEGQVDRFYKKLQARQDYLEDIKTREESKVTRPVDALAKAGIKKVGQFLDKLEDGDDAVLAIDGFGQKSLVDVKKKLRALGYELPEKVK